MIPILWLISRVFVDLILTNMRVADPERCEGDHRPVYFPPSVVGCNAGTYIDGGRSISRSLSNFKQVSAVVRTHSPKVVE
jgi:hypothetical protein